MSLNSADFNYIRSVAGGAMNDLCTVQRDSKEQDEQGGFTNTGWSIVAANIPCRIATISISSQDVEIGDRTHTADERFLTVRFDQDIRQDDRILFEGSLFDVTEVRINSYDSALRVRLQARS